MSHTTRQHNLSPERSLWAAVVITALDDAVAEERAKKGVGQRSILTWLRSRNGRDVLSYAGIDPDERVYERLREFVELGIPTITALARRER